MFKKIFSSLYTFTACPGSPERLQTIVKPFSSNYLVQTNSSFHSSTKARVQHPAPVEGSGASPACVCPDAATRSVRNTSTAEKSSRMEWTGNYSPHNEQKHNSLDWICQNRSRTSYSTPNDQQFWVFLFHDNYTHCLQFLVSKNHSDHIKIRTNAIMELAVTAWQ